MQEDGGGLIAALNGLFGGAATTLLAATIGRLAYHSTEVRKLRRRLFGPELLWEIPVAIGMAIVGEALSAYLGLPPTVRTGVIAVLAFLGPRGTEVLIENWITRKPKDPK